MCLVVISDGVRRNEPSILLTRQIGYCHDTFIENCSTDETYQIVYLFII